MSQETLNDTQKDIVDFLLNPATYGGEAVEHIETHISHVFLAGARAYKLKKAVRFDFLDFSTLKKRRDNCWNELAINRRTAPDMYLNVIPVTGHGAALELNGPGPIRDWLVVMARFDQADLFSRLARAGALTRPLVGALADAIAHFHQNAEPRPDRAAAADFAHALNDTRATLLDLAAGIFSRASLKAAFTPLYAALARNAGAMDRRARHGWLRHCHGDMHLGNICLFEGVPTPFDAIEFSTRIASIDVLYDLAFPVMDLIHHSSLELANALINRYLEATRDYAGLALMPVFLSARALIRAMALGLSASKEGAASRSAELHRAHQYLTLSTRFFEDHTPRLIAIGGLSGAGKTTVAQALAPVLPGPFGAVHLRSDGIRKRLFGRTPEAGLPPAGYEPAASAEVYRRLNRDAYRALKAGYTVITDATFLRRDSRTRIEDTARRAGVAFTGIWLEAPLGALIERVTVREGDASDADADIVRHQLHEDTGPITWRRIDNTANLASTRTAVLAALTPPTA